MKNKKVISFPLLIILILIVRGIYKQIDFENLSFHKPALAAVYIITLLAFIFLLYKNFREK